LSLEPDEFAAMVRTARRVHASLGQSTKTPQPSEIPNRDTIRKGVLAARDLTSGTTLKRDDLMWARPATEFPASTLPQLIGRKLLRAISKGWVIHRVDVEEPLN
jgi:N,N'-diacetyllegionaminate synthase